MKEFEFHDRVMGCDFSVSLIMANEQEAAARYARMLETARAYDAQFSRFIPESELSRLNATRSLRVSEVLLTVLLLGRELYEKTDGAFNPLVDISRYGYDADIAVVAGSERTLATNTPYDTDFASVSIDEATRTITLQEGQSLDVGGYLKGYCAERLATLEDGVAGVIVNLGGDMFTRGVDAEGAPFAFEIEHPSGEVAARFTYADGAIATSGSYKRAWTTEGKAVHHLLDASGRKNPDTDIVSATVLASTGADAEGYATAAFVLGSPRASQFLVSRGAAYYFILKDGSSLMSNGFPLITL